MYVVAQRENDQQYFNITLQFSVNDMPFVQIVWLGIKGRSKFAPPQNLQMKKTIVYLFAIAIIMQARAQESSKPDSTVNPQCSPNFTLAKTTHNNFQSHAPCT